MGAKDNFITALRQAGWVNSVHRGESDLDMHYVYLKEAQKWKAYLQSGINLLGKVNILVSLNGFLVEEGKTSFHLEFPYPVTEVGGFPKNVAQGLIDSHDLLYVRYKAARLQALNRCIEYRRMQIRILKSEIADYKGWIVEGIMSFHNDFTKIGL